MDRSGLAGEDGPTHHGAFDLAYLRHIPGMVVAAPKDGNELRNLMATALDYDKGPFAIRYPKASAEPFTPDAEPHILPVGQWEVVRQGTDAAILAVGPMVEEALKASQALSDEGLSVEVVNCRFVNPLDEDYLAGRIPAMGAVVTIEEGVLKGGFGSAVLEWKEARSVAAPVFSMGLPDAYVQHGPRGRLLQDLGLSSEGILRLFKAKGIKPATRRGSGQAAFR
jgi:1-deoxy-D-xylulose-5-phosphate synthase